MGTLRCSGSSGWSAVVLEEDVGAVGRSGGNGKDAS